MVHAIPTGSNPKHGLFTGELSDITYGFATVEDYYKYAHWWHRAAFCSEAIEKTSAGLEAALVFGGSAMDTDYLKYFNLPVQADCIQLGELISRWRGINFLEVFGNDFFEPVGINAEKLNRGENE